MAINLIQYNIFLPRMCKKRKDLSAASSYDVVMGTRNMWLWV